MAKHKEAEVCSICLEEMSQLESLGWMSCCGNKIHKECCAKLQKSKCKDRCPLCRAGFSTAAGNFKRCFQSAKKGKLWAMGMLGDKYRRGVGTAQSLEQARYWYEKAASQGDIVSQYNIGWMYKHGEGGPVACEQARMWWLRSAAQGNIYAQCNLAAMHHDGDGIPICFEQAWHWYAKAAAQGFDKAQFNIGWMYYKGDGGSQSFEQARHWWEKAAAQGHYRAQVSIDCMDSLLKLKAQIHNSTRSKITRWVKKNVLRK